MSDTNSSGTIWWVYLLECTSGRIYTGVSPDVVKRVEKHMFGKGALFTRLNKPQRLLTAKPFPSKVLAVPSSCLYRPSNSEFNILRSSLVNAVFPALTAI